MADNTLSKNDQISEEFARNHYASKKYDSKKRFISYWHQIDEVIKLNPESVLEIGIGNGFISRYLRHAGLKITTIDINKSLKPDLVGSVLDLPFNDNYFDTILCCEVFEHIHYDYFSIALENIFIISHVP